MFLATPAAVMGVGAGTSLGCRTSPTRWSWSVHVLEFLRDGRRFTNDWATELRAVIYKKTFKVEVDSSSSLNDLSELAKGLVEKGVYEKDAQAELPQRWVQEKEEAWIQLNSVCLVG